MKTVFLLVALHVALFSTESRGEEECPLALCANPHFDPETGCSSCEGSRCNFRGCVKYGAFGPSWRPDNCTLCHCDDQGQSSCTRIECSEPDCHGYPIIHEQGKCCCECDYGIAADVCGVVPDGVKSLYLALGDSSCQEDVLFHHCDKGIFTEGRDWYECIIGTAKVTKELSETCRFDTYISHVTYEDVTTCEKRKLGTQEIPQDFDPNPYSCALYIEEEEEPTN